MSAPVARVYAADDMSSPELHDVSIGTVGVQTARSPDKKTPNEDAALVLARSDDALVLAVADGLGGSAAGGRAARIAVDALATSVAAVDDPADGLRTAILNAIEAANAEILALGIGAGTTLAVAEIVRDELRPYHVGDSEVLVVGQRGRVKLQTVSHAPVAYQVEAGVLAEEDAVHHAERNVISNAVGTPDMRIEIGSSMRLAPRDTVLLSSDGLTDNLYASEIVEAVRKGPIPAALTRVMDASRARMVDTTGDGPSKPDDLTVMMFRPTPPRRRSTP